MSLRLRAGIAQHVAETEFLMRIVIQHDVSSFEATLGDVMQVAGTVAAVDRG